MSVYIAKTKHARLRERSNHPVQDNNFRKGCEIDMYSGPYPGFSGPEADIELIPMHTSIPPSSTAQWALTELTVCREPNLTKFKHE